MLKQLAFVTGTLAAAFVSGSSLAQEPTIIQRNDKVNNVTVIDDKIVVRQQLPGAQSGIRINTTVMTPEEYAKEQAIENRIEGEVKPNKAPSVVKGETDNVVQAKGVYAIKRSESGKACIDIGGVGGGEECEKEKGRR